MSNESESIWVKVQVKSSSEKIYGFFRNHLHDLVNLFPEDYDTCQLVKGQSYSAGSVVQFQFYLGGSHDQVHKEKYLMRVVDDVKKYIIYEAVEGDMLKHYKVFRVKLEVVNGGLNKVGGGGGSFAKWTVDFEKTNENVPSPENYLDLFVKISKGIDAYVSKN